MTSNLHFQASAGALFVLCGLALAACGGSAQERQGADTADKSYSPTSAWARTNREGIWRRVRLYIDEGVAKDCGLTQTHFEIDSAEPMPQERLSLKAIADCINRPELEKSLIELVGRADSTGQKGYNVELGRKRAERVKELLVSDGVSKERISITTRGEADAVGNKDAAPYSQGYDRRVDILVHSGGYAPE